MRADFRGAALIVSSHSGRLARPSEKPGAGLASPWTPAYGTSRLALLLITEQNRISSGGGI
ncbi:hypothetical protein [Bradyrhizobium oropedii]|uniref:hypothetical protein n=1 Tax=Bradyrhizobium oropedii TaxID=1571201 RepID=UPI001E63A755|nr:hypothetical protein [Bradyrhizobium oropedii]